MEPELEIEAPVAEAVRLVVWLLNCDLYVTVKV